MSSRMSDPSRPTGQALIDLAWKQDPIELRPGMPLAIVGLSATLGILTFICLVLRIFVRAWVLRSGRHWGWDDTLSILSVLTFIPQCVCAIVAARFGLGTRDALLTPTLYARAAIMAGWWQMFYAVSGVLCKAGIAVTLLRLAEDRKYRWSILAALISMPLFTIGVIASLIITCKPVGAQWDLDLGPCPMHNWLALLSYPFTGLAIVLDWSCAIIPWLLIRKLQINKRVKRSLILVLSLGAIASIGAIVRLPYIKHYLIAEDQLYHTSNIVFWSLFENGMGIIAASLPPLHKLFKYYENSSRGTRTTGHKLSNGGGAMLTIGGTPKTNQQLSGTCKGHELGAVHARSGTATKVSSMRRGTWDRLGDEELNMPQQEHAIMVHKSFYVIEENESEMGQTGSWQNSSSSAISEQKHHAL